jgi:hypothetical protein
MPVGAFTDDLVKLIAFVVVAIVGLLVTAIGSGTFKYEGIEFVSKGLRTNGSLIVLGLLIFVIAVIAYFWLNGSGKPATGTRCVAKTVVCRTEQSPIGSPCDCFSLKPGSPLNLEKGTVQ